MKKIAFVKFAETVLGLRLSKAQRVLAKVAIDNVAPKRLGKDEREIAKSLFGDVDEVPIEARRVQAWSLGRGSGKTTLSAALMVYVAVTASLARCGPGMTAAAVALAPRTRTARLVVSVARALVRAAPDLERLVVKGDDSKEGFSLFRADANRAVRIAAFPASRGGVNVRGFDVLVLVLDEAEFFASGSEYAVTDHDSYSACVPRLLPGPDHHAIFISTPWPSPTLMGELYEKNFGDPKTALAAHGSTVEMRDHDPDLVRFVEQERARDADTADREFFCSRDAGGSQEFFSGELVRSCVEDDLVLTGELPDDETASAGMDLGLTKDSSTLCVVGRASTTIRVRRLVELLPTKGKPLKLSQVIGRFADELDEVGLSSVAADSHAREPAREWAEKRSVEIDSAPGGNEGKFETFETTRRAMKEGRLRLPPNARLLAQLRSVVVKPLPAGGWRVELPRRVGLAHADLVASLVIAVHRSINDENADDDIPRNKPQTYNVDTVEGGRDPNGMDAW